jgi:hypothetical protein
MKASRVERKLKLFLTSAPDEMLKINIKNDISSKIGILSACLLG